MNSCGSQGPPSRAYSLCHVTIIIKKMVSKHGEVVGALFEKVLRFLLAQIILTCSSDYSGSVKNTIAMKSTKVQTLGAVTLHATTACTDDASIVGLSPLNWAVV